MNTLIRNGYSGRTMLVAAVFVLAIGFAAPAFAQNVGELNFIPPEIPESFTTTSYPTETFTTTSYPTETFTTTSYPTESFTTTSYPAQSYTAYDVYDVYGVSSPSYGYGASASLGYGYSSYPYYYPTSTFYPTSSYYPYQTASYYPTSPSNTYAPTTISNPTSTYAPTNTSTYSPTSTYAPTDIYSPTNTSTYAPTDTSIYSPTNTSTYAPSTYSSSVYSPTSNPTSIYSPSSVYAPSDSHNSVYSPSTVTTDSHNYTGPVTISVVSNTSQAAPQYPVQYGGGSYFGGGSSYVSPSYFNTPVYYAPSVVQAPTCRITASASPAYLNYGSQAVVLSWSSTNANSGYITPLVGTVAPAGSTTVFPNQYTLYTLTVSGNGGTSSCQTYTTSYGNYAAPAVYSAPVAYQAAAVAPYVALTQIPYTGFDFGPFGNAMYWALLALFAVAISYLVLYFLPTLKLWQAGREGAFALIASMVGGTAKVPVTAQREAAVSAPAVEASQPVSVARNFGGTKDAMLSVGETEGGIGPRIVVLRS